MNNFSAHRVYELINFLGHYFTVFCVGMADLHNLMEIERTIQSEDSNLVQSIENYRSIIKQLREKLNELNLQACNSIETYSEQTISNELLAQEDVENINEITQSLLNELNNVGF